MSNALVLWDETSVDKNKKLASFVEHFQFKLPKNAYGTPLKILDPTVMIDSVFAADSFDEIDDEVLDEAAYAIDTTLGYPCIEGVPIWERLPNEKSEYHQYLTTYINLKEVFGTRTLMELAKQVGILPKYLSIIAKMYHWTIRAKAFDMWRDIESDMLKEQQRKRMEKSHHNASEKLLNMALTYLESHPNQLNPKIAVQMIDLAVKVGRQTAGLSTGGGRGSSETNININQANNNIPGVAQGNTIEEKMKDTSKGFGYAESILHVLNASGALQPPPEEIIDVEAKEDET